MMTKQEVAQEVRERLTNVTPGGVTLHVVDDDIYKVDEWWRVPVRPSRWRRRMLDFYENLAIVEDGIQEREHLNIMLAAGMPMEAEAEAAAA